MTTLQEITGRESGFIIYEDGIVICCNWSSIDGLPRYSFVGLIGLGEELNERFNREVESVLDVINVDLDDVSDYSDGSGVLELRAKDCGGLLFDLGHAQIICPEGWH